jgi:hypothetical protein
MNDPVVNISDCEIIKCSNCGKDLLIIKSKVKNDSVVTKLQVGCAYCGDHSYVNEIKGTFMYHPSPGLGMKNFVMKDDIMKFNTVK